MYKRTHRNRKRRLNLHHLAAWAYVRESLREFDCLELHMFTDEWPLYWALNDVPPCARRKRYELFERELAKGSCA